MSDKEQLITLSHSSYRKRVRQEYQRLQQSKRARLVAVLKTELQENRREIQSSLATRRQEAPVASSPLPPQCCSNVELPRKVTHV